MEKNKVYITPIELDDPEYSSPTLEDPTFTNTKWKMFRYENESALNTNTFHTFDNVFTHIKHYMEYQTEQLTGVTLLDVEIPQRDPAKIRKEQSPRELLSKSVLPRGIALFNPEGYIDPAVGIPTMTDLSRIGGGMTYAILNVRSVEPENHPDLFNWAKDISFTLNANPKWSSFTFTFNILVSDRPQAHEIYRIMKMAYPLNELHYIYAEKRKHSQYGMPEIIPYTVEAMIPPKIVNLMKKTFRIPVTEKENTKYSYDLLRILQGFSDNRIEYKVNGADRSFDFFTTYATPICLIPNDISFIDSQTNQLSYTGVHLEFNVMYLDLSMFRLNASLLYLNPDNPDNQVKGEQDLPVYTAPVSERIGALTVFNREEFQYEDSDRKVEIVNVPGTMIEERHTFMEVSLWDFILESDHFLEYVQWLDKRRDTHVFTEYFQAEIKRGKVIDGARHETIVGTDKGITIDYTTMTFQDRFGEADMHMYIVYYLNKEHFQVWKEEMGYTHRKNLSGVRNQYRL